MNGIEKIIEKIENDCSTACGEIISKAQAEAQAVFADAQNKAENTKIQMIDAAKKKCMTDKELAISKAGHERKKAILAAKIQIINEVISESMRKAKNLPETEYFEIVQSLIKEYAKKGNGLLRFSKSDLIRIPSNFEETVNEMLHDSEKSLTISSDPIDIDSGFVIVYNDIEQNCSFDALLDNALDRIKDSLNEELFMGDSI